MKREHLLTLLILGALGLGVAAGQFFVHPMDADLRRAWVAGLQSAGEITFLRPLFMLIVPLVFASVVSGICAIGSPHRLGLVGGWTMVYFGGTTLLAVALGLVLVEWIQPGAGIALGDLEAAARSTYESDVAGRVAAAPESVGGAFMNLLRSLVPENPIKSAAERDVLGVCVFAILLGLALVLTGEPAKPVIAFMDGLFQALIRIVGWIMWLAPIGVLCIVAARVGASGLGALAGPMGAYMATVLLGLGLHVFVMLPLILFLFERTNPYRFLWDMRKVIVTAFSTSSSNATLPVTIEECQRVGGCSKRATNFVTPLGSTINMNGTALYEGVAVSFLFQIFNYDLGWQQQILILITATLAAAGAAGIPSAGLVTMAIVIGAVNSSLATVAPDAEPLPLWTIGIIYGVDRILDMCRTVNNVMGDAIGARLITRIAPDEAESDAPAA
jgi:Na+/H+-dicarboxylate symporter